MATSSMNYKHPLYNLWRTMKARCGNPRSKDYRNYGGRGIEVCPEWASFERFVKDMGPRPPGLTLDRREGDGPYSLLNCRWATMPQQCRNRRTNRRITLEGETLTVQEWAERSGLEYQEAYYLLVTKPRRKGTAPCLT